MDAVQRANSGHPGMPMGMADIAEVLWNDFLRHNPANPHWANRDRFILSNGHGSMLQYALLHLSGYDLSLDELKHFRQLHSKTPGHPEYGYTPGVETTTGPLGQGVANAVGMALAEKALGAQFNRPGHEVVDHHTYVFLGDGCLMEGVSHEACSLAGTLKLGKLVAIYDDNGISIDGEVQGWFTDDTAKRFEAYGWQVIRDVDGHDPDAVHKAIRQALDNTEQPALICARTTIGFGSPNKAGTEGVHGAALGEEEVAASRRQLGWTYGEFEIPESIYEAWNARNRGAEREKSWEERFDAYRQAFPELAAELERRLRGELPEDFAAKAEEFIAKAQADGKKVASRKASQAALEQFGPLLPELVGGSADLTGSNNTNWSGSKSITGDDASGNYIHYGVREFGMSAIMSGMALHGGFIPYGGTFLVFSDYARNAVRMSALMGIGNIYVYTHDSIGLGEDGPTHQPVEHLASLRIIPNLSVWRPCDATETVVAWRTAIERRNGPTALALSRQGLAPQERDAGSLANIARGGYVLRDCGGTPEVILMASGSEIGLAMEAADRLASEDRKVRVVSMPSIETFMAQDATYREQVLPAGVSARVAVEAGVPDSWRALVGNDGIVIGLTTFGESAPAGDVYRHFGVTADATFEAAKALI